MEDNNLCWQSSGTEDSDRTFSKIGADNCWLCQDEEELEIVEHIVYPRLRS